MRARAPSSGSLSPSARAFRVSASAPLTATWRPRSGLPAPARMRPLSSSRPLSNSRRPFGHGRALQVFISPSHASSSFGRSSPGPAAPYMRETGMAGYKFGFGTEERFGRTARQLHDAAESPGPGSYEDKGVLGQQSSSKLDTVASFGFGSSTREHVARVFCNDMMARASGRSGMGASRRLAPPPLPSIPWTPASGLNGPPLLARAFFSRLCAPSFHPPPPQATSHRVRPRTTSLTASASSRRLAAARLRRGGSARTAVTRTTLTRPSRLARARTPRRARPMTWLVCPSRRLAARGWRWGTWVCGVGCGIRGAGAVAALTAAPALERGGP